jgi:altronate dehydratase small subunit
MPTRRALMMHPDDNVATAVEDIAVGETVGIPTGRTAVTVEALERIPFGFKIALEEIPKGQIIRKYGETIGIAGTTIPRGALVHVHNLEGTRARGDLQRRSGR